MSTFRPIAQANPVSRYQGREPPPVAERGAVVSDATSSMEHVQERPPSVALLTKGWLQLDTRPAPQAPRPTPTVEMPNIGDTLTQERAAELARHFGLDEVAERIEKNPEKYKAFQFDGVSGPVPDRLYGVLNGGDVERIIHRCALPHDLAYAFGEAGDTQARLEADQRFKDDLLDAGVSARAAKMMYRAVRLFGGEAWKQDYSWGFARR